MVRVKLRKILATRNITQTELSKMTGIKQGMISEISRNLRDSINKKHLGAIMQALEITDFNEILEIVDD